MMIAKYSTLFEFCFAQVYIPVSFGRFTFVTMGFLGDHANELAEEKIYEEGGYPALWKFRIIRFARSIQEGNCCGKN
jgi:hypothetical protein